VAGVRHHRSGGRPHGSGVGGSVGGRPLPPPRALQQAARAGRLFDGQGSGSCRGCWAGSFSGHEAIDRAARKRSGDSCRARKTQEVLRLPCQIERKAPGLPRFLIVPAPLLDDWKLAGTTVVEVTINRVPGGRRSLKPWDDDRWFIELPQPICDHVDLSFHVVSDELPDELASLLAESPRARASWAKLTRAQKRMLREAIFAAKTAATRRRRAERAHGESKPET